MGETYRGPDRDPFPHREWGRFPASRGRFGKMGVVSVSRTTKTTCGMTSREAPQGQLNLAYPTGIEAEASAFGSKAPYRVVV